MSAIAKSSYIHPIILELARDKRRPETYCREAAGLKGEALLLGMAAVFANHVFFVLPIAERFYGDAAAENMAGLVFLDVAVIFCGTVLLTEILTSEAVET